MAEIRKQIRPGRRFRAGSLNSRLCLLLVYRFIDYRKQCDRVLLKCLRPVLRNVQIRSRRICPTQESVHRQTTDKTKGPVFRLSLSFYLMPGSSLLSHGETPHYHRRYGVSLLSSAWGQVGPPRYCRQANSVLSDRFCVLI